jgi:hypothetical protein
MRQVYKILYLPTGQYLRDANNQKLNVYTYNNKEECQWAINNILTIRQLKTQFPDWSELNELIFPIIKEHFIAEKINAL